MEIYSKKSPDTLYHFRNVSGEREKKGDFFINGVRIRTLVVISTTKRTVGKHDPHSQRSTNVHVLVQKKKKKDEI